MLEVIKNAVKAVIVWLMECLVALFDAAFVPIVQLLPQWSFDTAFIASGWIGILNEWFPLTYAISCVGIWIGLALAVYITNWILGVIPTVS